MIEQVRQSTGQLPREISAAAGCFCFKTVKGLTDLGVDVSIPPDNIKHTAPWPMPCGHILQEDDSSR